MKQDLTQGIRRCGTGTRLAATTFVAEVFLLNQCLCDIESEARSQRHAEFRGRRFTVECALGTHLLILTG